MPDGGHLERDPDEHDEPEEDAETHPVASAAEDKAEFGAEQPEPCPHRTGAPRSHHFSR